MKNLTEEEKLEAKENIKVALEDVENSSKKLRKIRSKFVRGARYKVGVGVSNIVGTVIASGFVGNSVDRASAPWKIVIASFLIALSCVNGLFVGNSLEDLREKKKDFNKLVEDVKEEKANNEDKGQEI